MKIIFAGTPPFAAAALRALHEAGYGIVLVLSQPDRPSGRGLKMTPSAVSETAKNLGLTLATPATLKNEEAQQLIRNAGAELMVVAAYGLLLPQVVLDIPPKGCLNIHGSLLPRWRGAAPIQRAIEAGDQETGICVMQMEAGLDTGPVLLEKRTRIDVADNSATLLIKLTKLGAESILEALAGLDSLTPKTQPADGMTYAKKIEKTEAPIDWTLPAEVIERRIRAFNPFPGCETTINGEKIKIWEASVFDGGQDTPAGAFTGTLDGGVLIACGEKTLLVKTVQKAGGKKVATSDWLRGNSIQTGTKFV